MPFYKVTYSPRFKRANVYSWGCNFNCRGCSYKINSPYKGKGNGFLSVERVEELLTGLEVERVHFLGGEPTLNPDLPKLAHFVRYKLGAHTKIGHSNGSAMPPDDVEATSVSIKAFSDEIHIPYTGVSNAPVLENFARAYENGVAMEASSVFIPGYIDCDEIEKIARFIAEIDPQIPYHIVGYIPVPDAPWRAPTPDEVKQAVAIAERHLSHVTSSCLGMEGFLHLKATDPRYESIKVA
jgi:pyruvate formate lyase activating enzyme